MPKVGKGMHFPYTKAGMADAKKAAKKSGKPMQVDPQKVLKTGQQPKKK
jgi:hypothetical protein